MNEYFAILTVPDLEDRAVGDAIRGCIACKYAVAIFCEPAIFQGYPEIAEPVLEEAVEAAAPYAFGATLVKHLELRAVIAHQSVKSRKPQVTVAGLDDVRNRVLRKAVVSSPPVEPVLSAGVET